ncbi:MAG: hypothetical protein AAGN46_05895 [Acidobacteriota bacterium]
MSSNLHDEFSPRLSKEERKRLLQQLEQSWSGSSPEAELQRVQQAIRSGELDQAKRLIVRLEGSAQRVTGLDLVQQQLAEAQRAKKYRENVRAAEDMLTRYIQQRKKQLADFALDALRELSPQHPRLDEYAGWVRDLDQEVALQQRLDTLLLEGRSALQQGDPAAARAQLDALRALDPHGSAVEQFQAEVEAEEAGAQAGASIRRLKDQIDEHIQERRLEDALAELENLRGLGVPKITIDQYLKRIHDAQRQQRDDQDAAELDRRFDAAVTAGDWPGARDVAQLWGRRFPNHGRAVELMNRAGHLEAQARRRESTRQGVETLERLIADGSKAQAELALKLLRPSLEGTDKLAELEARVRALPA